MQKAVFVKLCDRIANVQYSNVMHYINTYSLKKYTPKIPILVTEDGVEIFDENQRIYIIYFPSFSTSDVFAAAAHNVVYNNKLFSTIEVREEYILMNKPILSLSDVASSIPDGYHILRLRELIKHKLKS